MINQYLWNKFYLKFSEKGAKAPTHLLRECTCFHPKALGTYLINCFSKSSNAIPFVSGTFMSTQINWINIMQAKKPKIGQGLFLKIPSLSSINTGATNVIKAAKTQCTLAPKAWPFALR